MKPIEVSHSLNEFEDMLHRAVPVQKYLTELEGEYRNKYDTRRKKYKPNAEIVIAIKKQASNFIIVAIGASWCKDCVLHIPVLDIIRESTGLRVEILGGVKTNPLDPNCQWAVPPSPPEVNTLCITRIPTILIYTCEGKEIGRIEEHPVIKSTLEEELLYYMENPQS